MGELFISNILLMKNIEISAPLILYDDLDDDSIESLSAERELLTLKYIEVIPFLHLAIQL